MDPVVGIVFVLVYTGMFLGGLPALKLDRAGVALLGALALVISGRVSVQSAWQAIDAPTLHSTHMPSSFHPHHAQPGGLACEERLPAQVVAELERRGHRIQRAGPWDHGRVLAVTSRDGRYEAAASPRFQVAYAAVLP